MYKLKRRTLMISIIKLPWYPVHDIHMGGDEVDDKCTHQYSNQLQCTYRRRYSRWIRHLNGKLWSHHNWCMRDLTSRMVCMFTSFYSTWRGRRRRGIPFISSLTIALLSCACVFWVVEVVKEEISEESCECGSSHALFD
jgi:hypothetical protein